MQCKDIQLVVLEKENDNLSQDLQDHLASCEECRNFLSTSQTLLNASSLSAPSESIDRAILASAREMMDKQETAKTIMFPFMVFQRIAVAAAAVLICSLVVLHFNKQTEAPTDIAHIDTFDEPIIELLSIADMELTAAEEEVDLESEYKYSAALADTTSWDESFDEEIMQLQCEAYFEEELIKRNEADVPGGNAKQHASKGSIQAV